MKPLIDSDVLFYEVGFAAEAGWQSDGTPPFDYAREMIDERIANICAMVGASPPTTLFTSGVGNFRYDIAKRKPYKDRPSNKPFHYYNLKAYVKAQYDTRISEGMEADDLMAIEQTRLGGTAIICTRDKDLRQVPGWIYSWELGAQPSFGPVLVDPLGSLRLSEDGKKLSGTGTLFFYAQCLTGDPVDSVPGLPKCGAVKAFNILEGCDDINDGFKRVLEAYRGVYGPLAENELLEQGRLLWMTRELNEDGSVKLWEFPIDTEDKK